jgi:hypothetical protein
MVSTAERPSTARATAETLDAHQALRRQLCMAATETPQFVDLPLMTFLMVDGGLAARVALGNGLTMVLGKEYKD